MRTDIKKIKLGIGEYITIETQQSTIHIYSVRKEAQEEEETQIVVKKKKGCKLAFTKGVDTIDIYQ